MSPSPVSDSAERGHLFLLHHTQRGYIWVQQHRLSVLDLQVRLSRTGAAEHAELGELASWRHPGIVTALEVGKAALPPSLIPLLSRPFCREPLGLLMLLRMLSVHASDLI